MRNRIWVVLVTLALSACASTQIQDGMNALLGQPAEQLFTYIGYPNGETTVAGHRILIYNNNQTVTLPTTNTARTSGSVTGYGGTATYTGTTTYQSSQSYNWSCELRVEIDNNNIIRNYSFYGNQGGCARYANVRKAASGASGSSGWSFRKPNYERCSPQQIRMGEC